MKYRVVIVLAIGHALVAARAGRHHSFAATYFEDKTQKIEGNIVQFMFRNPHSFVHVERLTKTDRCSDGRWNGQPPRS
jgi:hypothetical protein